MIDELKRIETMMHSCIDNQDYADGHIDGDQVIADLVRILSERCYNDEKACVERICKAYTEACERWYHE